tara:strand:+ start:446 stop:1219 length:774 start_codon:yes stop_codon:yes gene_type:complete
MPNFTIIRQTEPSDDYGCTNFETNQTVGDAASLVNGDSLDGSIIWILDANPGFTVNVDDFDIPNTSATTALQVAGVYRTFEGAGIPSPVLGIVFDQITTTRIKITLYLHPIVLHGITGSVFTMPNSSVSVNINITGCAIPEGEGINVEVIIVDDSRGDSSTGDVEVIADISDGLEELSEEESPDGEIHVTGHVSQENVGGALLSYTINASEGDRFASPPYFNISTDDHYVESTITRDDSNNIISTTINVFKKEQNGD